MIDRKTLDDLLLKQGGIAREELGKANTAIYNIAGQYVLEILNESKKRYIPENEIVDEFLKRHDRRFEQGDIVSAIERLADSKKLIRYRTRYDIGRVTVTYYTENPEA